MIKVMGLDIYGTVLASDDYDNEHKPRKRMENFIKKHKSQGIKIVTVSDEYPPNTKIALKDSGADINLFENFYEMKSNPKDFSEIIRDYNIKPEELLIIGDNYGKDILGAKKIGAKYFHISEYKIKRRISQISHKNFPI